MSMNFLTDPFLIEANRFDGAVMVTGAGGCIGAWILAILARSGVQVVASDLTIAPQRASLIMGKAEAQALNWAKLDVTDGAAVAALVRTQNVQAIIHLAGLQVPFCAANPALGARVNVEGTINVLEAARHAGIKRTVFASSTAAHGFPAGGPFKETLYGAYKVANEQTAHVYWKDWQVPSICLRPSVVYGVGRDQGMSSKNTVGMQAAVLREAFEIPFTGAYSWLYAGEAASAFIAAASRDGSGAHVFDLNGRSETVESGLELLDMLEPGHKVTAGDVVLPFPSVLDDSPLRNHVADYPEIPTTDGVAATLQAFKILQAEGRLPPLPS